MKFPFFKFAIIFITVIILLGAVISAIFYFLRPRNLQDFFYNPFEKTPVSVPAEKPDQGSNRAKAPEPEGRDPYNSNTPGISTGMERPFSASSMVSNIVYGSVISIQPDGITIMSDGSSFEDRQARQIVIKVNEATVISEADRTKHTGLSGLEYLSAGDKASAESSQNIGNKTEFTAEYVRKR